MEEDVSVTIGDVVVTGSKTTGVWLIRVDGGMSFQVRHKVTQLERLDSNHQPTGTLLPSDIAFQVEMLELMSRFMDGVAELPGIPATDKALIEASADDLSDISLALQMGESVGDAKAATNTAFSVFYGAVGDAAGAMVTSALMGAAGLTASSFSGPGAIVGGGLAFLAGYIVADSFPAEALADVTTDMIFLGYESIHALEQETQRSIGDAAREIYRDVMREIYKGFPEGAPLPQYSSYSARHSIENDITEFMGSHRFDSVSFVDALSSVSLNLARDSLQDTGGGGQVRLFTIESVIGSSFNDMIIGNFAGNTFRGGAGNDHIDGGEGFDFADYADATDGIVIDLRNEVQNLGNRGSDTLINVEGVIGGDYGDIITGNDAPNTLIGGWGNDTINGGGGDDVIVAHGRKSGTYGEVNYVDGGAGSDTISFADETLGRQKFGAAWAVNVDLAAGFANFVSPGNVRTDLTSIENVIGGRGADTIRGNADANELIGGGGNDTISGKAGDDYIDGGSGSDTLDGGDGIDTLSFLSSSTGVTATLGASKLNGDVALNFENMFGSLHNDTLSGDQFGNKMWGAIGNDVLNGLEGNDELIGGAGNDTLDGGTGDDTLSGGDGDDFMIGGGGNDHISGGQGRDVLILRGDQNEYLITLEGDSFRVADTVAGRDGFALLSDIELLQFEDGSLLELTNDSGQNYLGSIFAVDLGAFSSVASENASDWWI